MNPIFSILVIKMLFLEYIQMCLENTEWVKPVNKLTIERILNRGNVSDE